MRDMIFSLLMGDAANARRFHAGLEPLRFARVAIKHIAFSRKIRAVAALAHSSTKTDFILFS
jgi:hypothetical protein